MAENDVLIRAFETVRQRFETALEGVTGDQLTYRPHPEANSIAWLAWHLTRWQDAQLARFSGADQLWVSGWAGRFDRPADPADTGIGHTSRQVAELTGSAELLRGYHAAVVERTIAYLRACDEAELAREIDDPARSRVDTVAGRLVGVLSDNFQHVGQMAYLRGLIAGAHWGAH
ncbi:MAG TPA: DinB family protein [Chloroflexota bacterium]|nr:DinB family protein [Chloroflexota bacterium]